MQIEVALYFRAERITSFPYAGIQISLKTLNFLLEFLFFAISTAIAVVNMEMPPLFLVVEELRFHGNAIEIILLNVFCSTAFKSPSVVQNSAADKIFHSFDHNQKAVTMLVNIGEVLSAKISAVKDKTQIAVAIPICFVNHAGKLRNIINAAGILLIEQWLFVFCIKRHRVIEYRRANIVFCMAVFCDVNVSGLAVFVCGIVRNIDALALVSAVVLAV